MCGPARLGPGLVEQVHLHSRPVPTGLTRWPGRFQDPCPWGWGATTNSLHGPGHQYVSWSLPLGGSQSCVTPGLLATCDRACFFQLRGSGILVALAHACRQAPRHQARVVSRHGTRILTWKCHRRFGVRYRPDFVRQSVINLWQQAHAHAASSCRLFDCFHLASQHGCLPTA